MKTSTFYGLCFLLLLLVAAMLMVPAKAADQLYACRTDRTDLVQIEFHNIQPTLGNDYWMLGDGVYVEDNVAYIQALTAYEPIGGCVDCADEINFIHNGMAIIGNQDYSIEMVGLPETPVCGQGAWYATMSGSDFSQLPDQGPASTPEPTPGPTQAQTQAQAAAPVVVQAPQPTVCPFMEIDFYTNQVICH